MAANDNVVIVHKAMPTGTIYATDDVRVGGSTPAEGAHVWDFDASTIEYMDFLCELRGYEGGGITLTLPFSMSSATSGGIVLQAAVRRMENDAEDIDSSHSYDYNASGTITVPSASGEIKYPTVAFTDGADMDSWANGELAIVRVRRKTDDAGDDAAGDLELWSISGRETA
jgi:hypothetical protein